MIDLDPRTNTDDRLEPIGDTLPVVVGQDETKTTTIAQGLEPEIEKQLRDTLWRNRDLFAWTTADMLGIHPSVMSHRLSLCKEARPVAQKKRKMGEEWTLYVDGASGRAASGAGIVLEGPKGFLVEHSLIFKLKTSNNQAEYEALVAG